MSKIFKFNDHIMLVADYKDPKPHKHLAAHIIVSLDKEMQWDVNGNIIKCRGISIASNILHTGKTFSNETIVFLFTETSNYSYSLKQKYLESHMKF